MTKRYRGRIAPTPSGYLHLGHLSTFKTAKERANLFGGKLILRIEDIDSERCNNFYTDNIILDLKNFGISWDEGDDVGGAFSPYTQSKRISFYKTAFTKLLNKNLIYPCIASRTEIKKYCVKSSCLAKEYDEEYIFPNSLRNENYIFEDLKDPFKMNWRFKVCDGQEVKFIDKNFGEQSFTAGRNFGDFLVWRKNGSPSYELAVTVDDITMEITEVVRGKDLLLSTARQILLYEALEEKDKIPDFFHCPLLIDNNGKKLSKSTMKNSDKKLLKNFLKSEK